ncbi:MAG: ABC transporter permease [Christensenellales bacterium]|jgi:putative aldouronate transport system permease protein
MNSINSKMIMKRSVRKLVKRHWQYYLLVLLPLVHMFIFYYLPMVGLQVAFKNFNASKGIWGSDWVGLRHFQRFLGSYNFSRIFMNTFVLSSLNIVVSFPIPIIFALMLNEVGNRKYKRIAQSISYAPHFISTIVVVAMLNQMLSLRFGIVNNILDALGFARINFLAEPKMFRPLYILSGIWQHTGYSSIIYIAALSAVDPTLYEAAKIDGATRLQKILYIDIPSILPTAVIILILEVGRVMNLGIDKILAMQNAANLSVSEVISTHVYSMGIINADFSYASAVGFFNSVINLVLVASVNLFARKYGETSLW